MFTKSFHEKPAFSFAVCIKAKVGVENDYLRDIFYIFLHEVQKVSFPRNLVCTHSMWRHTHEFLYFTQNVFLVAGGYAPMSNWISVLSRVSALYYVCSRQVFHINTTPIIDWVSSLLLFCHVHHLCPCWYDSQRAHTSRTNLILALPTNLYIIETIDRATLQRGRPRVAIHRHHCFSPILTKNAMPQRQDGADLSGEDLTPVAVPPAVRSPPRLVVVPIGKTGDKAVQSHGRPLWAKGARVGERGVGKSVLLAASGAAAVPTATRRRRPLRSSLRSRGGGRSDGDARQLCSGASSSVSLLILANPGTELVLSCGTSLVSKLASWRPS
jgi:hypothetical protein